MSEPTRGLGKGLDALFRNNEHAGRPQSQNEVSFVSVESLASNPKQPRKYFTPETLEELAASIRSQGIVQPLLVRPAEDGASFEIVAGERRWRAAKLAGLAEVPVLVRQLSDMEIMAAALIENLQREDLNPLEEARAMSTLRSEFGLSQDELANMLGKSRPAIANALRLLNLIPEAQEALEKGQISAGHARAILSVGSVDAQSDLVRHCIQDALSVRDAEYAVSLWKEGGAFPWQKAPKAEIAPVQEEEPHAEAVEAELEIQADGAGADLESGVVDQADELDTPVVEQSAELESLDAEQAAEIEAPGDDQADELDTQAVEQPSEFEAPDDEQAAEIETSSDEVTDDLELQADEQAVGQEAPDDVQAVIAERQASRRKTQSPLLQQVQKQLRQDLKIRASISGTEARGRISLNYQSQEELQSLLQRLGISALGAA